MSMELKTLTIVFYSHTVVHIKWKIDILIKNTSYLANWICYWFNYHRGSFILLCLNPKVDATLSWLCCVNLSYLDCSHLMPKLDSQVQFLLSTNVNTPFFQGWVHTRIRTQCPCPGKRSWPYLYTRRRALNGSWTLRVKVCECNTILHCCPSTRSLGTRCEYILSP